MKGRHPGAVGDRTQQPAGPMCQAERGLPLAPLRIDPAGPPADLGPDLGLFLLGQVKGRGGGSLGEHQAAPLEVQLEIGVAVSGVPAADLGQFSGSIRAEVGGVRENLVGLTVQGAQTLQIRGAKDEAVVLDQDTADFRHDFWVDVVNGTPVPDITVQVDPFQGPRSVQVDTTVVVDGRTDPAASFDLPGLGQKKMTVSATFATSRDRAEVDRARATLGEVSDALREVFGVHRPER